MSTASPEIITLNIPNRPDYVGVVRLTISGVATRMNFSIDDIEDIKVAVSEACSNAVQYAYSSVQNNSIQIDCNIHKEKLEITIQDKGQGFDINTVNKKTSLNTEVLHLGLGITFIKNLMDEANIISYKGKGTTVHMIKYLSPSLIPIG